MFINFSRFSLRQLPRQLYLHGLFKTVDIQNNVSGTMYYCLCDFQSETADFGELGIASDGV